MCIKYVFIIKLIKIQIKYRQLHATWTKIIFEINISGITDLKMWRHRRRTMQPDKLGIHVNVLLLLALTPHVGSIVGTLFDIDAFHHVFEEILPAPFERSINHIIFPFLVRCTLVIICIQEFCRFGCFMTILVMTCIFGAMSVITKIQNVRTGDRCILLYSRLRVIGMSVLEPFRVITCVVLLVTHFVIVSVLWMLIRCWKHIPPLISLLAGVVAFFFIIFTVLLLPILASIELKTESLVDERRKRHYWGYRSGHAKYYFKWWVAQRRLVVPCASFFTCGPGLIRGYIDWLSNNVASTVLLIGPEAIWGLEVMDYIINFAWKVHYINGLRCKRRLCK